MPNFCLNRSWPSSPAPTRAAAIYGDLTEMAATRGRLWFWAAYARTLFALTWRIVLALFVADDRPPARSSISSISICSSRPPSWRTTARPITCSTRPDRCWPASCRRCGSRCPSPPSATAVRDRFVQLTFAVAVGTTVAFLFIPWASLLCAAATLALAIAALTSKTWRKPLEVLLWSGAIGFLVIAAVDAIRINVRPAGQAGQMIARYGFMLTFQASLLALAFVCSRTHRWLLEAPSNRDSSPA